MTSFWDTYSDELPAEKERRESWEKTLTRNSSGLCLQCNSYTEDLMFGDCPRCGRVI